jgi:hypothetical protein
MSTTAPTPRIRLSAIDPDAWDVHAYHGGHILGGTPTAELVRASQEAGDIGAVLATLDQATDLWHYVREDERARYERRGDVVQTVYVMAS